MSIRFKISDAKGVAKKNDYQAIVVLCVERDGTVTIVTYGESKDKCNAIGAWAKGLWDNCISINPFKTVFGWGEGGKK